MHSPYIMQQQFQRIDLIRKELNLHHWILNEYNSQFENEHKINGLAITNTSKTISLMEIIQYYHYNHIITIHIMYRYNFGMSWQKNINALLIILYQKLHVKTE